MSTWLDDSGEAGEEAFRLARLADSYALDPTRSHCRTERLGRFWTFDLGDYSVEAFEMFGTGEPGWLLQVFRTDGWPFDPLRQPCVWRNFPPDRPTAERLLLACVRAAERGDFDGLAAVSDNAGENTC
jgi:hypothetical protein